MSMCIETLIPGLPFRQLGDQETIEQMMRDDGIVCKIEETSMYYGSRYMQIVERKVEIACFSRDFAEHMFNNS